MPTNFLSVFNHFVGLALKGLTNAPVALLREFIIMQSSSTFIAISGPIPEVKKSALINDWENVIAYWEGSEQSAV